MQAVAIITLYRYIDTNTVNKEIIKIFFSVKRTGVPQALEVQSCKKDKFNHLSSKIQLFNIKMRRSGGGGGAN